MMTILIVSLFAEHIWQVTLKPRGLCSNNKILQSGLYRLCLTNKTLSLIQLNREEPTIVFEVRTWGREGGQEVLYLVD